MNKYQLYIDGKWIDGSEGVTEAVINPATEDVIGHFCHATSADIEKAVASAKQGLKDWSAVPAWERGDILKRAADLLRERKEKIARILTLEQGKPLAESVGEIDRAADFIEWGGEEGRRVAGRLISGRDSGCSIQVRKVPVGVVAAFAPWNFPIVLTAKKLAGLLGAGCSCVVKPAEETPGSVVELIKVLVDAGVPGNALNMVLGKPAEISNQLIADPAIRKITFTGSSPVGKLLASQAGQYMKPVTMELGGHSPVIVFDDVDVKTLAASLVAKKFFNAGQVCVSPTRFFVHKNVYDEFVKVFVQTAKELVVGDGCGVKTKMGPLANVRRLEAMETLVKDAVEKGAKIETGGNRIGQKGFFFEPTVLTGVSLDADLMSTEIFGPIVPILPFDDEDEVLAIANDVDYGLAGYFFTKDADRQAKFSDQLTVGTIGVNDVPAHIAEVPLGGWGDSGYGVEGGIEALDAYLKSKYVSYR